MWNLENVTFEMTFENVMSTWDFWNDIWKCDVTFDFKSFENMVPIWDLNFTLNMNFDAEIFFCVLLLRNVSICEFAFDDATFDLYFWLS